MSSFDWEKFGDDIKKTVQDAVDSKDFVELNQTIAKTVNDAMGTVADGIKTAGVSLGLSGSYQDRAKTVVQQYQHGNKPAVNRNTRLHPQNTLYYASMIPARVGGAFMAVFGLATSSIFGILFLVSVIMTLLSATPYNLGAGIATSVLLGIACLGTGIMGISGVRMLARAKRFRKYVAELGNRGYIEFQQLAQRIGKSPQFLLKDTRRMIRMGWFKQGRIDSHGTSLMVTDSVYQEYQNLLAQIEEKKVHDEAEAMRKDTSSLEPDIREIVKAGDDYIEKIRKSNIKTTCPEIAGKISRIEVLLERIFSRVREEPETATDTRRLMDYYLPTTVKLIEAYQELDKQPVKGENIKASKREIESTLDTLNLAFEKMLDSMFKSKAIDVSADISVLNTILAQEGLTKRDFS